MIYHLHCNDKSLFTEKLVQGDPWTSALQKEKMNGEEVWQTYRLKHTDSYCEVADFRRRRRSSRSMDRSHLDSMRSQFYGTCQICQSTSLSRTRQRKHGKHHNIGTTHRILAHRIERMHTGKSSPIGPISKGP